jgi:uncharacterized membrane protein YbhN (UPF0104 family)
VPAPDISDEPEARPDGSPSRRRRVLLLLAKLAFTAAVFAFLLSRTDVGQLGAAMLSVPLGNLIFVIVFAYVGAAIAALRWRVLLASCGATRVPSVSRSLHLILVVLFYNNYMPGAVGGDIVRSYAAADSFDESGFVRALSVGFLDRLFGLGGLMLLTAVALLLNPLPSVQDAFLWLGIGAAGATGVLAAIVAAPNLAARLPGALARLAAQIPPLRRPTGALVALVMSTGTQACAVFMGYFLISPLAPDVVTLGLCFAVLPLASAAAYFPLTMAGLGVREAAFIGLFKLAGVPESASFAASLVLGGCLLLVAGSGGILNMLAPLRTPAEPLASGESAA